MFASGEDLTIHPDATPVSKEGDGITVDHPRIIPQKQPGLYTVLWHPIGGMADPDVFCALSDALSQIPQTELRLAPDESAYIINLTGQESEKVLELTKDSGETLFETSISCIGAATCQQGLRDSQSLLSACVKAVRAAGIPDKALPQIHISGCPSSCGTHQIGAIGFRGAAKKIGDVLQPAFTLYVNGNDRQGRETMGREIGVILETNIPDFLVKLGTTVAESKMDYERWNKSDPKALDRIASDFLA